MTKADDLNITEIDPGTDKLVIAGGNDDVFLLRSLADDLHISNIQIGTVKGDQNFASKLLTLPTLRGWPDVKSLGLVRDADSDANKAFEEMCCALREAGLPAPTAADIPAPGTPKVVVHLFPGLNRQGTLETLCLETVSHLPHFTCVEQFFQCLQVQGLVISTSKIAKAKAHAYLASCPDPVAGVGTGFLHSKDVWSLSSPVWEPARIFLRSL